MIHLFHLPNLIAIFAHSKTLLSFPHMPHYELSLVFFPHHTEHSRFHSLQLSFVFFLQSPALGTIARRSTYQRNFIFHQTIGLIILFYD